MERLNRFRGFCFSSFCDNIRTYLVTLFLLLFGGIGTSAEDRDGICDRFYFRRTVSYASVYVKVREQVQGVMMTVDLC